MKPWIPIVVIAGAVVLACSSDKTESSTKLTREALMDPQTCQTCHTDHYKEWSGSMHAYASDDPVFLAMNKRGQRETNGQLGDFCVKCHAPIATREGLTKDGLNLDTVPAKMKGVTCFFCHQTSEVQGTHDAALGLAPDLAMRGPFADPVANSAHDSVYSPLHDRDKLESASACGACHDIVTGHGANLERTFQEWQASVFAKAPGGATCGQCHMAQSANLTPIAQAPGVFARRKHAHTFAGVDLALTPFPETDAQKQEVKSFLDTALQSALCVGAGSQIRVLLDNVAGGHGFPSGASQDRRVWTEIVGYAGADKVYESGVVPDDKATTDTSTPDPDRWLMRDCIFDETGAEVHMFWQAASFEGNALPAQATFDTLDPRFYQTHVAQKFPRDGFLPKQVDRVTMKVFVRAMDRDVLDDLVKSGDLAADIPAKIPTMQVGETLEWTAATANEQYVEGGIPFQCISKTNFAVQADRTPAVNHLRCKP